MKGRTNRPYFRVGVWDVLTRRDGPPVEYARLVRPAREGPGEAVQGGRRARRPLVQQGRHGQRHRALVPQARQDRGPQGARPPATSSRRTPRAASAPPPAARPAPRPEGQGLDRRWRSACKLSGGPRRPRASSTGSPGRAEHPEAPLLDHLLVGVLSAWVDREKAGRASPCPLRVVPRPERGARLPARRAHGRARAVARRARRGEARDAARTALQDVYDGTHGLDLEPLRGREPDDLKKFLRELPHTMGGPAASIFQLALGDRAPRAHGARGAACSTG